MAQKQASKLSKRQYSRISLKVSMMRLRREKFWLI
jgi:hypothetical protein